MCSRAVQRRQLPALALAVALLSGLALLVARPTSTQADQQNLPLGVLISLPPGSQVQTAISGDFMGIGTNQWAVLYTTNDGTRMSASLAVASPSATGWTVSDTVSMDFGIAPALRVFNLGGIPTIAFSAEAGAHSGRLVLIRWNGSALTTIFDGISDGGPPSLKDVDGDGVPEVVSIDSPYCRSHADSPVFPVLYQWNGTAYVDYPGQYPNSVLSPALDQLTSAFARSGTWSPPDVACLYGVAAYLAAKAGDTATEAQACQRAIQTDPNFIAVGLLTSFSSLCD